jgi:diaminobutyrate-2-oxoglutarate transaminase
MDLFAEHESNVRSYCRSFPDIFERAKGPFLYSETGREYIDFFTGAGTLNYGHNNDYIKKKVMEYFELDTILHALDMYTTAKRNFIQTFVDRILQPRNLHYKLQFCGPTGTNAVEAALKLARKVKRRPDVFAFEGGFHGMSLGALSASANIEYRAAAGIPLSNVTFMQYSDGMGNDSMSIQRIDDILGNTHSGIEKPAAIIFESVQAEGGVNVASVEWLKRLRSLCDKHDVLLICDDIQVGCFRTGNFFSFERAEIVPDIVLLSKSISGIGLPMSLLLMKPEIDIWKPGEHTGTFRGNQLAFVGAAAALEFADKMEVASTVARHEIFLRDFLLKEVAPLHDRIRIRGIGMIWGVDVAGLGSGNLAKQIAAACFERGLIIERCGREDTVLKLLPPLTIEPRILERGCRVLRDSVAGCLVN